MSLCKVRLLRITTAPISLHLLLKGQPQFMEQQGFEVLTASSGGKELAYLQEAGLKHAIINLTRTISPVADIKALFQTILLIRKFKPQIVHTHTPKAGLIGMLAAWICRVPVRMHTVAGLPQMEATGFKKQALNITELFTGFCAQKVYPNSNALLTFMQHTYPSMRKKLAVIGAGSSNGIDTGFFSPTELLAKEAIAFKQQHGLLPTDKVFCFIGRIVGDKGINELLQAFDQLTAIAPVKLVLVGGQEKELDPLSLASLSILENNTNIVCTGYMHDVRIPLMAADCFVFPSYREGFPNVVMQAMCMGVPCIVSDINGCNELVRHGVTGFIIPPKSSGTLYQAMLKMLGMEEAVREITREARQIIEQHYEQKQVWSGLLSEYTVLLEKEIDIMVVNEVKESKQGIAAFIMTRNRPVELRKTIDILFKQTFPPSLILIVDNSEDDITGNVIAAMDNKRLQYHRTGYNAGPAGAAKIGMEMLFSQGFDWVLWVDDDDPPLFPDLIERVISVRQVVDEDCIGVIGAVGQKFNAPKARIERLSDHELTGVVEVDFIAGGMMPIVSRKVYENGILPNPMLFFGFEDLDFSLAVKRAGLQLFVPGSLMEDHRKKFGRINLKRHIYRNRNKSTLWREYYSVRSLLHILLRKEKVYSGVFILSMRTIAKAMYGFKYGVSYGFRNAYFLPAGIIDGFRGKLGMTVLPVTKKRP